MSTLRDIMSTHVNYVTPQDNVFEVARIMKENNIGMVPVVENGMLRGILTDRDIVIRGIAEKNPNSSTVSEIMTQNPVYGTPEMSVDEAAQIMANAQIRRLPVVENNQLVGVVSLGDLAVRDSFQNEAGWALNQISQTHNPNVSSDLQL